MIIQLGGYFCFVFEYSRALWCEKISQLLHRKYIIKWSKMGSNKRKQTSADLVYFSLPQGGHCPGNQGKSREMINGWNGQGKVREFKKEGGKSGKSQVILTVCRTVKVYHSSISTWRSQFLPKCYIKKSWKIFWGQGEVRKMSGKLIVEKKWPPCSSVEMCFMFYYHFDLSALFRSFGRVDLITRRNFNNKLSLSRDWLFFHLLYWLFVTLVL